MKKYLSLILLLPWMTLFSQHVIVKPDPTIADRFSKKIGNLRLSTSIVRIGKIRNNESRADTIRIFNDGSSAMNLALAKLPDHLRISLGTAKLASKSESWIALWYDARKKKDYGYVFDRFELITSDTLQYVKFISVSAQIEEYFPVLSAEDSASVQKAKWLETSHHYGKINKGDTVTHDFRLTNEGSRNLIVRKATAGCACLKTIVAVDTIAPGATGTIKVVFDTSNQEGKDTRRVYVILNDPFKPETILELTGEIGK